MLKSTLFVFLAALARIASATGAGTPSLFYLVSSSKNASSNLLPLRISGAAEGYSSLTGSAPIVQFDNSECKLTAGPAANSSRTFSPMIGLLIRPGGPCVTYGKLGFTQGTLQSGCARYAGFRLESHCRSEQFGKKLVVNSTGGFYACGLSHEVWYQSSPKDGPPDQICEPIELYTVPVFE